MEIREEDKYKTAFNTPFGKFEFNRTPFGLTNAPKYFNAIITKILYKFTNVIVFIDDILIYDHTANDHLQSIKNVISVLQQHNIILNIQKSEIFTNKIKYLGFEIYSDRYTPDLDRLKDFTQWRRHILADNFKDY